MRFTCHDPLNEVTRVMDIARKMSLELDHLTLSRRHGGAYALDFQVVGAAPEAGRLFEARVRALLNVAPEPIDV
jgi:hypothetical protein